MSRGFPESTGARCGQTLAACVVSTESASNKNSRTLFIEWSLMKLLRIGVGEKRMQWFTKDGVWRWQNLHSSDHPSPRSVMHFARVAWHRWDANRFFKFTIMHNVTQEINVNNYYKCRPFAVLPQPREAFPLNNGRNLNERRILVIVIRWYSANNYIRFTSYRTTSVSGFWARGLITHRHQPVSLNSDAYLEVSYRS